MDITKVITHAGVFHLDEILAIATLRELNVINEDTPIERKFQISNDELDNPSIAIIDVGKNYNDDLNNFDHHQDGNLPASNLLILSHFYTDDREKELLRDELYIPVSDNDVGINVAKENDASLYSCIRNLNNIENGFETAINIVQNILKGYIATAKKAVEGEQRWLNLPEFKTSKGYNYKIQEDDNFIPNWKELAKRDNIHFLVTPNARGGYQAMTRNSDEITFPENENATFRHNSGFMIVFKTKEEVCNFIENNF